MRKFSAVANLGSILMLVFIHLFLANAVLLARDGRGFTQEEQTLRDLQAARDRLNKAGACAFCKEKAARDFFSIANGKETSGVIDIIDASGVDPVTIGLELADALISQGKYEEAETVVQDSGAKAVMDPDEYTANFGEGSGLSNKCKRGKEFQKSYYEDEGGVFQTFKSEIETSLEKLEEAKKKLEEAKTKVDELEEEPEKPENFDPEKPPKPPSEDDEDYEKKKAEYDKEKEKYDKYKEWNTKKEEAEKLLSETEEQFNAIVEELNGAADKYVNDSSGQGYYTNPEKENALLGDLYSQIKEVGTLANDIKSASDGIGAKLKDDGTKDDFSGREGASELSDRTMRALQEREVGGTSPRLNQSAKEHWADSLGGKACTCGSSGTWEPATGFWPKAEDTAKKEEEEEKENDTPRGGSHAEHVQEVAKHLEDLAKELGVSLPEKGSSAYDTLTQTVGLDESKEELENQMQQHCPQNLYGGDNAREGRKNALEESIINNSKFKDIVKDKVWPPTADKEHIINDLWGVFRDKNADDDAIKAVLNQLKNKSDAKVENEGRGGGESDDKSNSATSPVSGEDEYGTFNEDGTSYEAKDGTSWGF